MRVLEPKQFKHSKKKRSRLAIGKLIPLVIAGLVIGAGTYLYHNPPRLKRAAQPSPAVKAAEPYAVASAVTSKPTTIRMFKGNDFKTLFRSLAYPNTELFSQPPTITGDLQADTRIRKLAEARGYMMTSLPVMSIVRTGEATTGEDDLLQPLAYQAWQSLRAAAKRDGIEISILSGYRSPEFQRDLFLDRLYSKGITTAQIASGRVDAQIEATLLMTAVPGYSRHHSGYTVDLQCNDGSGAFGNSSCFKWLNANNYQRAKEHGWIPSYPEEAAEQGPEPEPWEYVWVGPEAVSSQ